MDLQSIPGAIAKKDTVNTISGATNESPDTVQQIIEQGLPLLLGQMGKNTTTAEGADSLNKALDQHTDSSVLDSLSGLLSDSDGDGNPDGLKILGKVFGDTGEAATAHVAEKPSASNTSVTKILSYAAPLVLG